MRIVPALAALILTGAAAAPAAAADWKLVSVQPAAAVFVDKSSIQRSGDIVTFSLWAIYRKRGKTGTDNVKALRRANCGDRSFNDLERTFLYRGRVIDTSRDRPTEHGDPGSLSDHLVTYVCDGPGARPDPTFQDPYKASKARGFWKQ